MSQQTRTLTKTIRISGTLHVLTGLRLGGYSGSIQIGGVDNPIIRDPLTEEPYIPGSSIKGKLRSLFEIKYGLYQDKPSDKKRDGLPHSFIDPDCKDNKCPVCYLFGSSAADSTDIGPARLVVRDARLTEDSRKKLLDLKRRTGWNMSELKSENYINRKTIQANPRMMERIPADTEFEVEFILRVFSDDDEQKLRNYLIEALELLEADYLGGSGTRGYGRVEFELFEQEIGSTEKKPFYPTN